MFPLKNLSAGALVAALLLTSVRAFPWEILTGETCDPCDDGCDPNSFAERDLSSVPRLLLWNDTSPWGENEVSQWRIRMDEDGNLMANELRFDCSQMPDICSNMCYGVYCKGRPWTLTINRDDPLKCAAARKANNCGIKNPNYCSARAKFPAGYSCDEYPFASTLQGQTSGNVATRCVDKSENNKQGGTISSFYQFGNNHGKFADGTSFEVVLLNYASIQHCEAYKTSNPADCTIGAGVSPASQK